MLRVWIASSIAMTAAFITYYAALHFIAPSWIAYLFWLIPGAGAAIGAVIARGNKFNVGLSTAAPAILIVFASLRVAAKCGLIDDIGVEGTVFAMVVSSPLLMLSSICGALSGEWLSRLRR